MRLQTLAVPLVALLVVLTAAETTSATKWKQEKWPTIEDVSSRVLYPGERRVMNFTFLNRLPIKMVEPVLSLEVYARLTDRRWYLIHEVTDPPVIEPVPSGEYEAVAGIVVQYRWEELEPGASAPIRFRIKTSPGTPVGVYVLRMKVQFVHNEKEYDFWSRGHFNDSAFLDAMNMTFPEGVEGILPETSFEVMSDPPDEFIYVLGVATLACFGLAGYLWWKKR